MSEALGSFTLADMTIQVDQKQSPVLLLWRGVLDSKDPDKELLSFLDKARQSFQSQPVSIDFRELSYINSVNILSLINFVVDIAAKGSPTRVLFHSAVDWQRLTAQCLRVIIRSSKNVNVECIP
jgi:hypothetical protein